MKSFSSRSIQMDDRGREASAMRSCSPISASRGSMRPLKNELLSPGCCRESLRSAKGAAAESSSRKIFWLRLAADTLEADCYELEGVVSPGGTASEAGTMGTRRQRLPFKLVGVKELKQPGFYLKFLEIAMLIATALVARLGKDGQPLSYHKTSVDADALGRGVCVAYLIISPVLLLGYTVGEVSIQRRKMEFLFNAAGAFLLILSGSIAIDFWRTVGLAPIFVEKSTWERIRAEFTTAAHAEKNAGLCLGCLSILTGFLYLADATFGYRQGGVTEKASKQSLGHLINTK